MARIVEFEGRRIEVPADATDAEIADILSAQSPAPAAQSPEDALRAYAKTLPTAPSAPAEAGFSVTGTALAGTKGIYEGLAALLGAPVDLVNNAPRLANLLPGVDNVGPISDNPIGGRQSFEALGRAYLGAFGREPYQPQNTVERVANRVGMEIGMTAPGVGGALVAGRLMAPERIAAMATSRNLPTSLAGQAIEAARVNPVGLAQRETALATAAGTGAGIANEIAGNPQSGDNFWSDFLGSVAGVAAGTTAGALTGAVRNAGATIAQRPEMMDEIVRQAAAERLLANSSTLAEQAVRMPNQPVDTRSLAAQLRSPSEVETLIPGYQPSLADRARDPGLTSWSNAISQDPAVASRNASRRENNQQVVNSTLQDMAPAGAPGDLRVALEASRDRQIGDLERAFETARGAADTAVTNATPLMADAAARGSSIRGSLADVYERARATVDEAYAPVNQAQVPVEIGPLAEQFGALDANLSLAQRQRFLPGEASIPTQLVDPEAPTNAVPLREITGLRSALTDTQRAAQAGQQFDKARIVGDRIGAVDRFLEQAVPPELVQQLDAARAARRDVADRFERPGDAIAEVLRTRPGGDYRLNDAAVPGRFTPTDQGKVSDFRALMREAGTDTRAREAVADEILSQAQRNGLLERPEALTRWMAQRNIVLSEMPEVRDRLMAAGTAQQTAQTARNTLETTRRDLTTPGRSTTASYLKYGDERVRDAIETVLSNPKPAEAARELVAAAGGSREMMIAARAALWEKVKGEGRDSALTPGGGTSWNGRKLRELIENPTFDAVARELWKDDPADYENIKAVFSALAGADGAVRARPPGTSGTGLSLLTSKFDPALSAGTIASQLRSTQRGVLSPQIMAINLGTQWLRTRAAQMQRAQVDKLTGELVSNPGLAAELLDEFNPATWAARRRVISQQYGIRATQVLNLLDERAEEEGDPVMSAIKGAR